MELASLEPLGKIAGLGGIAIGLVVLLIRPVIDRVATVPAAERGPTLRFVAMGAFGIGALGIVAWLISVMAGGNVSAGPDGVAAGRDISGNVTINAPPGGSAPQAGALAGKPP